VRPAGGNLIIAIFRLTLAGLPFSLIGCETPPEPVTVELVNQTSLNVVPNLFVSAGAADAASLFSDSANLYADFVDRPIRELRPAEVVSLTFDCEAAASLGSHFPQSFDPVNLALNTSTDAPFLLNGSEFGCGQIVRFYFFIDGTAFRVRAEVVN
jgi:hypothetical protein